MEAILKKEIVSNKVLCRMFGVLAFVCLTGLGAFVRIPLSFTPVPLTLQTFFVLLSGAFLGSNLAGIAQLSYLFLGVTGLPIFTGPQVSGLSYLSGPTGGYLFGFVLASLFIGRFIKYIQNNLFVIFGLFLLGDFIILSLGVMWLRLLFGYNFTKLLSIGFLPFIPGDLLKAYLASILYLKLKSRLKEIF